MSADNGIYIAQFPKADGTVEYRVNYAGAIDVVDYGSQQEQDAYRAAIFGKAATFTDKQEAILHAHREEEKYDYLEYGVSTLKFDRPLVPMTSEEIQKVLDF